MHLLIQPFWKHLKKILLTTFLKRELGRSKRSKRGSMINFIWHVNDDEDLEDEFYLHLSPFNILQLKFQQLEISLNLSPNRLKWFGITKNVTLLQVFIWKVKICAYVVFPVYMEMCVYLCQPCPVCESVVGEWEFSLKAATRQIVRGSHPIHLKSLGQLCIVNQLYYNMMMPKSHLQRNGDDQISSPWLDFCTSTLWEREKFKKMMKDWMMTLPPRPSLPRPWMRPLPRQTWNDQTLKENRGKRLSPSLQDACFQIVV